jgi:gliding motility-associated-like protein
MEFVALLKIEFPLFFSWFYMKKLLFLVLLLSNFFGHAQYTLIPDANFEQALIGLGIDNGAIDGKVLTANVSGVTSLKVNSQGIVDLTGIQDFVSLLGLTCSFNQLTTLDISKNILLQSLDCDSNKLTTIDLSYNKDLQFIDCGNNLLTNLDLSKQTVLTNLYCYLNPFSVLDISNNIKLLALDCYSNQLTNLDVSKNTSLRSLHCAYNFLTSLDVSKNNSLEDLDCANNKLTNIDVSNNISLTGIRCNNNNNLVTLNLKNRNNINFYTTVLTSNPNLTCIQVDNKLYSDANWSAGKDATTSYSENCSAIVSNTAPVITATGSQIYCPGTSLNIVETISIIPDPSEPTTDAVSVQISSGYINGQDLLTLTGIHPTVSSNWIQSEGMLKLFSSTGGKIPYADFEAAIADVKFSNSSPSPSGNRTFSISLGSGQLSFLPRNKHFYEYVSSIGITWSSAKAAAEIRTYYGLQGYLATLTAADEAQLAGAQAPGAGWIGGSDAETEGVWKWVTGPEIGTIMSYTNWNTGEPNDYGAAIGSENYAHITTPGMPNGIKGSWNDLPNTGDADPTSPYHPQGYVVEYGGMVPGDVDNIQISASTEMEISQITTTIPPSVCGSGTVVLQATTSTGTINWYDASISGNLLGTGNSFTTPTISTPTTYYVDNGCPNRTPIIATVNTIPNITSTNTPVSRCGAGTVTLQANSTIGTINWYDFPTGGTLLATGTNYTIPNATASATYYTEAFNNGCSNGVRIPVDVFVYTPPVVINQEVTKCKSSTATLDAGVPGMLYLWSTGETTQTITVSTSGIYTVVVTSPAPENCSSTKKITVVEHNSPEIDRVVVNETTVVIYLKQEEVYFEFSVDGINYQSSNVFFNVQSGLQTAYVREVNLCSSDSQTFIVLIAPKFFTPNNDTYNDFWEVKGLINYPQAEVSIFDRYGKLITVLNATKLTWDGMLNKYPLPADDYWYVLKIDETTPEKRGHFSLKR